MANYLALTACNPLQDIATPFPQTTSGEADLALTPIPIVPHIDRWGIYRLELASQELELLFSSATKLSYLRLNNAGTQFAFSQTDGGEANSREEIFTLNTDGSNLLRLTNNQFWDLYPAWSPDDARIAFLSERNGSLGIFVMNADGSASEELFDSPAHEADLDWVGDHITFTKDHAIWLMRADGSAAQPLTEPPRAGEWGGTNLPFGDYDPRLSPDGSQVVFERLWNDTSPHGNYDIFVYDLDTSSEVRLTTSGYAQGVASWSHSGQQLVYIVAAIQETGQYDLYRMNADGSDNRNITPDYFPPQFLCHWAVFSKDDAALYFLGEWWRAD